MYQDTRTVQENGMLNTVPGIQPQNAIDSSGMLASQDPTYKPGPINMIGALTNPNGKPAADWVNVDPYAEAQKKALLDANSPANEEAKANARQQAAIDLYNKQHPPKAPKSGSVICTAFYKAGLMSYDTYCADDEYGKYIDEKNPDIKEWYLSWAKYITPMMHCKTLSSKLFTKLLWKLFGNSWSNHIAYKMSYNYAYKDSFWGYIIHSIGLFVYKLTNMSKTLWVYNHVT